MKIFTLFFIIGLTILEAKMSARAIIYSVDRTVISAEISGNIIHLVNEEGEYFKKGKLLAKIDCAIYEAQKKKIKVQKKISYLQMQKNVALEKLNSIGKFEVLISKEEYNKQSAELDIVSVNVSRCSIFAPFDGKVVEKKANLFQSVKPQQELLEIIGINNLEAKVIIPAIWLSKLKKGDKFTLTIDETGADIKAIVQEIGAVVDPTSQTVSINARLLKPYKNIIAGMSATAKFNTTDTKGLTK